MENKEGHGRREAVCSKSWGVESNGGCEKSMGNTAGLQAIARGLWAAGHRPHFV